MKPVFDMNRAVQVYPAFCSLICEERLYLDALTSFGAICAFLDVSPHDMDSLLLSELGLTGNELLSCLRSSDADRVKNRYGDKVFCK